MPFFYSCCLIYFHTAVYLSQDISIDTGVIGGGEACNLS